MKFLLLVFLATIFSTSSYGIPSPSYLLLLPHSGAGQKLSGINCLSWRINWEINNLGYWDLVPRECAGYVKDYMLGGQYEKECRDAATAAYDYAKDLNLVGDGKDIWVFDVDDTALSTIPFQGQPDNEFGSKEFNSTKYREWQAKGIAPVIPGMSNLYHKLVALGFKIVFITGRPETMRKPTETNLKNEGFHTWEKLILKQPTDHGATQEMYKSKRRTELVAEGCRILGNIGDQWSDLHGNSTGSRTFKVPNPMYYVS